jgi:acyl transferase domain-containing protein/NADPH:quinone reductase-like Zn-dependent oxidoreductase/NAD(P)-dependent dehydrogenase (short-subunit alcohol dehydrogenase family)/acyl carrier protein
LENAGTPKESVSGKNIGVFVGGNYGEHRVANLRDLDNTPNFDATGNQGAFLAGRLAYYFDLRGPTFTVDTACSSSMHALHLAVQSIRAGESEQAIVGASHLITDPDIWVSMGKLRLFSDSGRTHAFDHRAKSGYARGEGAGCLILKPLAQAQADNDHIFSVIVHTGISHNGRTVGIVAPCPDAQESLVERVFKEAAIHPCDVGFFEAHGTGTKKGDPIEATGIYKAVGRHFTPEDPLYIGSVKPNIGHLECASGIVSVIKGVLMLYYGFILPNADFERVNEAIPLEEWNMRVATGQKPWPAHRKYICVNNFGFSGSNSTCVLSAAPRLRGIEIADNGAYSPLRLFVLSANDESALRNSVKKLGIWIEQHAELYQTTMPRNLAYTLCQRRSHFPWRVAVVAGMCSDVAKAINSHDAIPTRAPSEPPRLAFVYTGQGAQWHAMGRELMRTHPVFLDAIYRADFALSLCGANFTISEELSRDKESSRVGLAHISQPICTAVQLALTDLFASFGVRPGAVTGHSSGEIGAAYAAGALTFEAAMAAAYYRGQVIIELQDTQPQLRGSMMAVGAGAEDLEALLEAMNEGGGPQVVVACENSPSSTTLSGDEEGIDKVADFLQEHGVFNRKLFVDVAYHSPHMKIIAESYFDRISGIKTLKGGGCDVEFFSSLRGRKLGLDELGPQYWVENLTQAVRFSTSLRQLCTEYSPGILLEIGPHAALKGPIMQGIKELGSLATKISYLPTLLRGENATRTCLDTAGQLFIHGYPLNFFEINHHREEAEKPELLATLYTYPWSRQKYCYESRITQQHRLKPFARNDLLGTLADWSNSLDPTWRNVIRTEDLPWLKEYQICSRMVFPVAGFISMVIEAAAQTALLNQLHVAGFEVKDLGVSEHLFLTDGREVELVLNFQATQFGDKRTHVFKILSYEPTRSWTDHCTGTVIALPAMSTSKGAIVDEREDAMIKKFSGSSHLHSPCSSTVGGRATPTSDQESEPEMASAYAYDRLALKGMSYPLCLQSLIDVAVERGQVTGLSVVRRTNHGMPLEHESSYKLHPAIVESMLQAPLFSFRNGGGGSTQTPCLLSSIHHVTIRTDWSPRTGDGLIVKTTPEEKTASSMVELFPTAGGMVVATAAVSMSGLMFRPLVPPPKAKTAPRELCFKVNWVPLNESALNVSPDMSKLGSDTAIVVVTQYDDDVQDPLVVGVVERLRESVSTLVVAYPFYLIHDWSHLFVVVCELGKPLLYSVGNTQLDSVQKMLTEARGLMWVTRGATRFPTVPSVGLAVGLVRTARSERGTVASTLDLHPLSKHNVGAQAGLIHDAFAISVLSENEQVEMEFAEEDGQLVVPRIIPDTELNLDVHRALGKAAPYPQKLFQSGRPLQLTRKVDVSSPGNLYFEDSFNGVLAEDDVEIAVAASALSADDVTTGAVDEPGMTIYRSCAGFVTRVGRAVKTVRVGDKVCALAEGPYRTHVQARLTSVVVVPDTIAVEVAACIPGPFLAVYYALVEVAKVQQGERVLIQLSGPAGFAALSVAWYLGASVYALIMDGEQEELAKQINLPAESVLDGRSIYLAQEIKEATGGEGMDVVLALSGCDNDRAWECLGNFGRFVEIRTPGNYERTRPELGVNASFSSIDMLGVAAERPEVMKRTLEAVAHGIVTGAITPCMYITRFLVPSLPEGIQMVRDGAITPVVVAIEEWDEEVMVSYPCANGVEEVTATDISTQALHRMPGRIFRSSGTHIIVGGTGGLGRSVAKYMIKHGARNVVLLSRTGGGGNEVRQLQGEMQRHRAHVTVMKCDVTDRRQVRRLIDDCRMALPPICGVVHAAMVLRVCIHWSTPSTYSFGEGKANSLQDCLIENMTEQDYGEVIAPKVYGASNIHHALETAHIKLDYFVVLSSAAGIIGSRGQGAYAAANTFLDSLMQFRMERGLPGTSLDLTAVTGAGYLAENAERQEEIMRNFGNETINEDEVLALFSAAVRGVAPSQCLTGLKLHLGSDGQWPYYANDARFADLKVECLAAAEREGLAPKQAVSPGAAFRAAGSDEEAVKIAAQGIVEKLSEILSIAVEDMDVARNITSYGLDSLTAIELRNWIAKELRANLQILELLSSGTINDLAALIVQKTKAS